MYKRQNDLDEGGIILRLGSHNCHYMNKAISNYGNIQQIQRLPANAFWKLNPKRIRTGRKIRGDLSISLQADRRRHTMPLRREQSRVVICQGFRMIDHMSPTYEDRVTISQIL